MKLLCTLTTMLACLLYACITISPNSADGRILINVEGSAVTTLLDNCILQLDFTSAGGTDQSGSSNDLTVDATHSSGSNGYYTFDGIDDEMTRGAKLTGANAVTSGNWSFVAWVQFSASAQHKAIMSHNTTFASERSTVGQGNDAGKIYALGGSQKKGPGSDISVDTWVHVAARNDSGTTTLYLDKVAYTVTSGSISSATGANFVLGAGANGSSYRWAGRITKVAYFTDVISEAEIAYLYDRLKPS